MKRASILALVLAFAMLLTANVAFAASDNYAITVPKVGDGEGKSLGTIVIKEDADSDGYFKAGDVITITLPSGVEYENAAKNLSAGDATNGTKAATVTKYVYSPAVDVEIKAVAKNYISVEFLNDSPAGEEDKLYFYFGDGGTKESTVEIDSDFSGDVKVEIEATGTPLTSGYVTVARVTSGDTTTTVSDTEKLAIDQYTEIGAIKIQENRVGVLDPSSDEIELKLPNDYKWDATGADITSVGVAVYDYTGSGDFYKLSADKDTLYIKITGASSGQPGFISLSGLKVYVPDDADLGDEVEVTVSGNEVTKEDVLIGTVADYGFKIEVEGDIETVVAGQDEQEVAEIHIDDLVSDTWIVGRTVTLELPTWAEWQNVNVGDKFDNILEVIDINDDKDELKLKVLATVSGDNPSGEVELKDLEVKIDEDAPEGDLTVEIYGSAGVEGEVVIAKVVPPFTVTAEKPEFVIGLQDQELGEITLTESTEGAIEEDKWIIIKAPGGMKFAETPTVEVVEGDIEIDDEESDENYFAFRVTGESARKPSVIKISDIEMTLYRTVPYGDVEFEVAMTKTDEIDTVKDDFDKAIDDDYYEVVTEAVVGTVVTPAPGEEGNSAQFTIGSTIYNVNGTVKAMDVAPYVKDGRTYTPVRYVAEAVGAAVDYDAATKTVTLTKGEDVVTLVIGSSIITVNGEASQMDVAAEVNNGRTMLPARFVAEAFGYTVGFDPATKAVVLSK